MSKLLNNVSTKNSLISGTIDLSHTATQSDDHALQISCDAVAFGDVKGMDLSYITGSIGVGVDEEAVLVNVNENGSTGGCVYGFETVATSLGSACVYHSAAGPHVGVIHHSSGTFGNMDEALNNGVNQLTEFTTLGNITSIFVNDNETVTIGNAAQFSSIEFLLSTTASQNINPTFEYSTGAGTWATFSPADGTNGMQNTGVILWELAPITSAWMTGTGGNYLIRITRTRNSLPTVPQQSLVQISAVTVYKWDENADVNINNLTMDGKQIIDVTNAEAFLVRLDNDGGDVFSVQTSGGSGNVYCKSNNAAVSQASGALQVTGGVGVGGAIYSDQHVIDTDSTQALLVRKDGGGATCFLIDATNDIITTNCTTRVNQTSGDAFVVKTAGGVAERFKVDTTNNEVTSFSNVIIDRTSPEALNIRKVGDTGDVFIVDTTNSSVECTASTASTSKTTGALVVTGGVGIGGKLYVDTLVRSSLGFDIRLTGETSNDIAAPNNTIGLDSSNTPSIQLNCGTGGSKATQAYIDWTWTNLADFDMRLILSNSGDDLEVVASGTGTISNWNKTSNLFSTTKFAISTAGTTPTNKSSSSNSAGEIRWTGTHIYINSGTSGAPAWKRVALVDDLPA